MIDFITFFAQTEAVKPPPGGGLQQMIFMFGMIFIVFWFLILRPQKKQQQEQKQKLESMQKGDKVVSIGGICGTVENIKKDKGIVVVKVADNVKIEFLKTAISTVESKNTPVKDETIIK